MKQSFVSVRRVVKKMVCVHSIVLGHSTGIRQIPEQCQSVPFILRTKKVGRPKRTGKALEFVKEVQESRSVKAAVASGNQTSGNQIFKVQLQQKVQCKCKSGCILGRRGKPCPCAKNKVKCVNCKCCQCQNKYFEQC